MTELLPCPFCGGDKPYVYGPTCNKNTPYNPADRAAPWVVCGQCHAVIHGMDWDESKESAIANWNRRAHLSQPQPVAQGEAVTWPKKMLDRADGSDVYGSGYKSALKDAAEYLATIPTVHRVVPVVLPDEIGLSLCAPISLEWMAERTGYRNGWNSCLKKVCELNAMAETVGGVTLRDAAEEALDLLEQVDPEHGITTQLRRVLAAAPEAGGV